MWNLVRGLRSFLGDPVTNAGKLFTMAYVLVGIGTFVALVTEIAGHLVEVRQDRDTATRSSSTGVCSDD